MAPTYVLGFMFDDTARKILLIRKRRPTWQAGRLNGIGGKIEPGESPIAALVREVGEETALDTTPAQWRYFGILDGPEFRVHCFETRDARIQQAVALTDELLEVVPVDYALIDREGQIGLAALVIEALNPQQPFVRVSYGNHAQNESERFPSGGPGL